jgi:hypothetical protein
MPTKTQPAKRKTTKAKTTSAKKRADRVSEAAKTVAKAVARSTKKSKAEKKVSALDAAAKLLSGAKAPMTTKELIDAMAAKGLWKSPGGKTPDRTLYSAILREIAAKGTAARFKKADRGSFASTGK